jgi:hypothetical protein
MHGKVFAMWVVSLNGQYLGAIVKKSSKWGGVSWETSFATKYSKDVGTNFKQIMTVQNRQYLDDMLKKLSREIARALSARQADVVRLPIDPTKL